MKKLNSIKNKTRNITQKSSFKRNNLSFSKKIPSFNVPKKFSSFSKTNIPKIPNFNRNNFVNHSLTNNFQKSYVFNQQRFKYGGKVLEHFEKSLDPTTQKQNVRSMNKNDPDVGTGWVGAPACGDVMKLQIKVNPITQKIEDACFKTFGCGSAVASSSVVSEMVKTKTVDEALQIKNSIIAEHLSLPPVKLHCSMLAEDAIRAAIKDYKTKSDKVTSEKNQ